MNHRASESGIKATLIIYFVLIVVVSVCTFAIPFTKMDMTILLTAYISTIVVIFAEAMITLSLLFIKEDSNQRVLSLPIVMSGYVAVIIQIIATIIFYVLDTFLKIPLWILIIVECFLLGYFIIQIIKGFFFKDRVKEYHEEVANTVFMDNFRAKVKILASINQIESLNPSLLDLVDIAAGSDPVSNEKTCDLENALIVSLNNLENALKDKNEEEAKKLILNVKNLLLERNTFCKIGK